MLTIKEAILSVVLCLLLAAAGSNPTKAAPEVTKAPPVQEKPKKAVRSSTTLVSRYADSKIAAHRKNIKVYEGHALADCAKAKSYIDAYRPREADPYMRSAKGWMELARQERLKMSRIR